MSLLSASNLASSTASMRNAMLGLEPKASITISADTWDKLLQLAQELEASHNEMHLEVKLERIKSAVLCALLQGGSALDLIPHVIFSSVFVQRCIIGEPAMHLLPELELSIAEYLDIKSGNRADLKH
ncbi:hypothetical protein [Shewanella gaetbuli]